MAAYNTAIGTGDYGAACRQLSDQAQLMLRQDAENTSRKKNNPSLPLNNCADALTLIDYGLPESQRDGMHHAPLSDMRMDGDSVIVLATYVGRTWSYVLRSFNGTWKIQFFPGP